MVRFKKRFLFPHLAVFSILSMIPQNAYTGSSASAMAFIRAHIVESIQITKSNDLDFGSGYTGSGSSVKQASNGEGAVFAVSGTPNQAYSIVLPTSVEMSTGSGTGIQEKILVDQFKASKASGLLGTNGVDSFQVGATRAPIRDTQVTGEYTGSFTVTVSYQ